MQKPPFSQTFIGVVLAGIVVGVLMLYLTRVLGSGTTAPPALAPKALTEDTATAPQPHSASGSQEITPPPSPAEVPAAGERMSGGAGAASEGASLPDSTRSIPPASESIPVRSHTLDGTHVSLDGCAREDGSILCTLSFENRTDKDRPFRLFTRLSNDDAMTSVIVDEAGREYRATEARFGTESIRGEGYLYRNAFPPSTPLKAVLAFSGVPADASAIRLLRVTFGLEGFWPWNGLQHADFKNLAISEADTVNQ